MTSSWTAPTADRLDPDRIAGERESLEQWLDYQRATLLQKCSGLTAEQLCLKSIPPATMSLIGLVRHMNDVERWWFRINVGEEDVSNQFWSDDNPDGDFDDVAPDTAEVDLAAFHDEIAAAKAAVADRGLDDVVPGRGHHGKQSRDVRWIYVHMIEEYARHNGHADLLRELIDGSTGD